MIETSVRKKEEDHMTNKELAVKILELVGGKDNYCNAKKIKPPAMQVCS